jgi:hypothetical protein
MYTLVQGYLAHEKLLQYMCSLVQGYLAHKKLYSACIPVSRGTSLIGNCAPVGPYSSLMHRGTSLMRNCAPVGPYVYSRVQGYLAHKKLYGTCTPVCRGTSLIINSTVPVLPCTGVPLS